MTVLTLAGKSIDWTKPPNPTTRVLWSQKTTGGKQVTGSFRSICHLDHLNNLAKKKFGVGVVVYQSAYNTGVAASAGTHDYDACFDIWIPGIPGFTQQAFVRANGGGGYFRRPEQGFSEHIHYLCLPPREGTTIGDDYRAAGFKVGKYVDGGWSLYGKVVASSQLNDYYEHKDALAGHAHDPSWFPPDIPATIFDLGAYVRQQTLAMPGADVIAIVNSHGPLARLGGDEGQKLWDEWETNMRARIDHYVLTQQFTTFITSDTNLVGALPNFGRGLKRIGGRGIDLIGARKARGGADYKVLKTKTVQLHIDGHDAHGSKIRVTFPSGKKATFWLVQANLGRTKSRDEFNKAATAVWRAFGRNAVYGFDEIDEGGVPDEHSLLLAILTPERGFVSSGWETLVPTMIGRVLGIKYKKVSPGCPGMAKVTPARVIVESALEPVKGK